ncbi:hypothetical protein CsSME_00043388 [Camellia sinensis var. sinensis]
MGNPLFRSLRRASSFTSLLNVVSSSNTLTSSQSRDIPRKTQVRDP